MKNSTYIFFLILLSGCESPEQKMTGQFTDAIKSGIKDEAFKANQQVELLEVEYLDKSTIKENTIDSLRLRALKENRENMKQIADLELKYSNLLIDETNARNKMAILNGKKPDVAATDRVKVEIKAHNERARACLDTMQRIMDEDSITRQRMWARTKGGDELYLVKYLQRSTISNHNELDTLNAVFNKQLQLKELAIERLSQ